MELQIKTMKLQGLSILYHIRDLGILFARLNKKDVEFGCILSLKLLVYAE